MNMNPWFLERMADYERDRIESDMKQIRLEKEAMQAGCPEENTTKTHSYRPGLFMQIAPTFTKWMFGACRQIHRYSSEK
jgi:hypothetical protein